MEPEREKYVLVYYVPVEHTKAVTQAVHLTGAGTWPGNRYGETCFTIEGTGQFSEWFGRMREDC